MKNSEKNSSKNNTNNTNNTNNNEVLSPETIKAQLKAACANMNAKETKDYIKSLDGYELKLTGEKPTQHYTVFYGEVRVCNVEQVQGIKADGTSRGCVSTVKVNFERDICTHASKLISKVQTTEEEYNKIELLLQTLEATAMEINIVLDTANERAAAKAKEAAAAKRAEAAKERATKKVGEKIAKGSDSEKIAAIAAALDCDYETAKIIFNKKRAQKTA